MLDMLKYYRKGFLSIIRSEFANAPEGNFDVKAYNDLSEEQRKKNLDSNKDKIGDYLRSLDKAGINDSSKDGILSYTSNDKSKGDIEGKAFYESNTEQEKFVENLLSDLGLDKYNLNQGVPIEEVIQKINDFIVQKQAVIASTAESCAVLKDECNQENSSWNPFGGDEKKGYQGRVIESTENVEEIKGLNGLVADLVDTKTNWHDFLTGHEIDELDKGMITPQHILELTKRAIIESNEAIVLNQINKLAGLTGSDADQIRKSINDGDKKEEIQSRFIREFYNIFASGVDIVSYLKGTPIASEKLDKEKQLEANRKLIDDSILKQIDEIDGKITNTQDPTEIANLELKRQNLMTIKSEFGRISNVDLGVLIGKGSLNTSGGLAITVETGNNYISSVTFALGTDGESVTGGASINVPIYSSDSGKFGVGATFSADILGGVSAGLGTSIEVSEGTSNFSDIIGNSGEIDFDKIKSDKGIALGGVARFGLLNGGISGVAGLEFQRDFKDPIQRAIIGFRNFMKSKPELNNDTKISDLKNITNNLTGNTKTYIDNFIKDYESKFNDNDKSITVNLGEVIYKDFEDKLIESADKHGFDISDIGLGAIFVGGVFPFPALLGRIGKIEKGYDGEKRLISGASEKINTKNIKGMVDYLNNKQIDGISFMANGESIRVMSKGNQSVLDNVDICVDKSRINELVGKDGLGLIIANDDIEVKDIYTTNDDGESIVKTSILIGGATVADKIEEKDLNGLNTKPNFKKTETKTETQILGGIDNPNISQEVDKFVKDNLLKFEGMRVRNEKNYVDFNENLNSQEFDKAKQSLQIILKKEFGNNNALSNSLDGLSGINLGTALSQIKYAFMIDRKMAEALRKSGGDGYDIATIKSLLGERMKSYDYTLTNIITGKEESFKGTYFQKLLKPLGVDTDKYVGYQQKIINSLSGQKVLPEKLDNTFSVVATYPRSGINTKNAMYVGMDIMTPGVATALGGIKEPLDEGDHKNRNYLIDRVVNSNYGENILEQIKEKTNTSSLDKYDLRYLLRGEPIKGVRIETEFYAFLNGICANESIGMEIKGLYKDNVDLGNFSITESYDVVANGTSMEQVKYGVGIAGGEIKTKPPTNEAPKTKPGDDTVGPDGTGSGTGLDGANENGVGGVPTSATDGGITRPTNIVIDTTTTPRPTPRG